MGAMVRYVVVVVVQFPLIYAIHRIINAEIRQPKSDQGMYFYTIRAGLFRLTIGRRTPAIRQEHRSDALEESPHHAHAYLVRTGPRGCTPYHQL